MTPRQYLEQLQTEAQENHTKELYLWPRTPIGNLQAECWRRVGVSDWVAGDPASRPAQVLDVTSDLVYNRLIPEAFTLIDICCGDALIPWHVKRLCPYSECYGADLNAGRLPAHELVQRQGVELFRIPIQRLFRCDRDVLFDVAVMFNTYRGWQSAGLRSDDAWLIIAADEWFRYHAKYTILTATDEQIEYLKDNGWWVNVIGKGEDDSKMILMWPCATGELEGLWQKTR